MLFAVLIISVLIVACHGDHFRVANPPIRLLLTSMGKSNVKTKDTFFQNALGLQPDSDFQFDYNKWVTMQNCGLYSNLTAQVCLENEKACLEIRGQERPSLYLAPEISASMNGTSPIISGGVHLEENNFLGLGQKLKFILSKKENLHGSLDLPVDWQFTWSDCSFFKNWKTSLDVSVDHMIEKLKNIDPTTALEDRKLIRMDECLLKFTGLARDKFHYFFSPYLKSIHVNNDHSKYVQGVQLQLKSNLFNDFLRCQYAHDLGVTVDRCESKAFGVMAWDLRLPRLKIQDFAKNLSISFDANYNFMRSWGRGRVPKLHGVKLSSTNYIRGLQSKDFDSMCVQDVYTHHILKLDLSLLSPVSPFVPGVFLDSGVYSTSSGSTRMSSGTTFGIALRLGKFKVNLAYSAKHKRPSVHFGMVRDYSME